MNLSAKCLAEPDLVDRVRTALRRHGVPGSLLTLELTEGIVVDDSVRNSTVLADLHALGLRLSMDDFGTGYSSLSQLRQLPIDELKIDKSFVLGMSTSQSESFIARSIVELAHNLGLRVVAEGVEDEVTRDLLAEMGCDKLQGFLVSRPLPDDRLENWLLARTGVRSAAPGAPHRGCSYAPDRLLGFSSTLREGHAHRPARRRVVCPAKQAGPFSSVGRASPW